MISSISLQNFRNFKVKKINFSDKITIIVGPNAAGKTNILESLQLLSIGKSFKATRQEEMLTHNEEITRVIGETKATNLEIVLTKGEITIADKKQRTPKKRLLVNGLGKRQVDFAGNFKTVLFAPHDLELVTQSPSIRRNFLDTVLSQVSREYRRSLLSYEKGVRQRNKLLYRIREENLPRSQLLFWNKLIIKNGNFISQKRSQLIDFINSHKSSSFTLHYSLVYDSSAISLTRLEQYAREEVFAAKTLVGPHRDDFHFLKKKQDLSKYGSRGEQRIGVLWLKLAELAFIEEITSEKPTLLLDDIFSELDKEHREIVFQVITNQQSILTTAEEHFIKNLKGVEKINI